MLCMRSLYMGFTHRTSIEKLTHPPLFSPKNSNFIFSYRA